MHRASHLWIKAETALLAARVGGEVGCAADLAAANPSGGVTSSLLVGLTRAPALLLLLLHHRGMVLVEALPGLRDSQKRAIMATLLPGSAMRCTLVRMVAYTRAHGRHAGQKLQQQTPCWK